MKAVYTGGGGGGGQPWPAISTGSYQLFIKMRLKVRD